MKNINKIIAFALMCVLVLGVIPANANAIDDTNTAVPISAQVFNDVAPDAWYYEAVNNMAQGGLLVGYSDGLFHPDDPITYGMFATILCRVTGTPTVDDTGRDYLAGKEGADHWAAYAIQNILQTKIFSRNYKEADVVLWRAEALDSLATLAKYMPRYNYSYETQVTEKKWTWDDIPDADAVKESTLRKNDGIHGWAYPYVLYAYNLGITTGTDSAGTCKPTMVMTRAQLCQMLYNMGISEANSVKVVYSGGIM